MCWFIEHLARGHYAPQSISNLISHLRTFYTLSSLNTQPWYHHRVGLALRAVATTIRHVPNPKDPVGPDLLRRAMANIHRIPSPEATRMAIYIMYFGFLRQSSLAPPSVAAYDPTRHLSGADVAIVHNGLTIKLKWSKTLQRSSDATDLLLPLTKDSSLCPVGAYRAYLAVAPGAPSPMAPLLRHADGNTLTVPFIRRQWAVLLSLIGADPVAYSLHSLRRGAASYTYNTCKAQLNDVMNQGTWRSSAVRAYIRPSSIKYNSVHKALAAV